MKPFRVGIALPAIAGGRVLPFTELRDLARRVEDAGFDSIWLPDHFFTERAPGVRQPLPECWTMLTALAATTSRVRIGSLVLCQSFRSPGLLAKMAATLQDVAAGRLILGLGAGWHEPEYSAFGYPFDHKVSRFEEYLTAVTRLLANEWVNLDGRYHQLRGAELTPPSAPVPVWVASSNARMNGLTAKFASGWNGAWYGGNADAFGRRVDSLRDLVQQAGRASDDLEYSVGVLSVPVRDEGDVPAAYDAIRTMLPALAQASNEAIAQRFLVGTGQQIAEGLGALSAAGADIAILSMAPAPFGFWSDEAIDVVLRDVANAL